MQLPIPFLTVSSTATIVTNTLLYSRHPLSPEPGLPAGRPRTTVASLPVEALGRQHAGKKVWPKAPPATGLLQPPRRPTPPTHLRLPSHSPHSSPHCSPHSRSSLHTAPYTLPP
ncbi:hypothetical protein E2C01_032490 [Portunus trituberculatus]|uniref:Uncharacterized protein n=1 Tax=Portunus trituberculatus TaxID=210409 RepID=A0A5B7EW47_PORTR|nr:hypothetical protein [Portunus trituberculatus]